MTQDKDNKQEGLTTVPELNPIPLSCLSMHACKDIGFSHHFGEIKIQINRLTETQDMSTLSERPPGLTINILFEGEVDFALGNEMHYLGRRYPNAVECSAYVLAHSEIFTRYQKAGRTIAKMNISVDYSWLISRCTSPLQHQQVEHLFQYHAVVSHWPACDRVIELANLLMNNGRSGIEQTLQNEYRTIELVSTVIEVLIDSLTGPQLSDKTSSRDFLEEGRVTLKQMVNASLPGCNNLKDIANKLQLSVSTLQRKFKQNYNMTVIEYVRIQRLEMARSGLLFKDLSIGEASYLAGYNHTSNFITAFKKQFGLTPTALLTDLQKRTPTQPDQI
jgi:AraC-like DNA-binding protein